MKPYIYSTLEKSHIRLLHLSLSNKGNLKSTFQYVDLHSEATIFFNSLSHSPEVGEEPTINLICHGKWISITQTLADALFQYIKCYPNEPVWIDQICIDQNDISEKSEQTKMMTLISEKAKTVVAWLGPAKDSTSAALVMISRVAKIAMDIIEANPESKVVETRREPKPLGRSNTDMLAIVTEFAMPHLKITDESENEKKKELRTFERITVEESETLGISFEDQLGWTAFVEFYDSPWFRGIWTPQHILPARQVVLMCGSHLLSWDMVKKAALWYHYKADIIEEEFHNDTSVYWTVNMDLDWSARTGPGFYPELFGMRTLTTYTWCFARLIERFWGRTAPDSRDKIYALVGLSDLSLGARKSHSLVDIDYSKSVREVYTDATRAMLCHGSPVYRGELDVIFNARWRSRERGWPTWVPDFRVETKAGCGHEVGYQLPESGDYKKFRSFSYVESDDPCSFKVQCAVIGEAKYVNPYYHASELMADGNLESTKDTVLGLLSSYPTGEDVSLVYAMTLMAGKLPNRIANCGTTNEEFAEHYLKWNDICQTSTGDKTPTEESSKVKEFYNALGLDENWPSLLTERYCSRRLFVTDTGYMGLGHWYMREGDIIALVVGFSDPCVLRPDEDGYLFVGEAYCHGVLNLDSLKGVPCGEDGLPLTEEIVLL